MKEHFEIEIVRREQSELWGSQISERVMQRLRERRRRMYSLIALGTVAASVTVVIMFGITFNPRSIAGDTLVLQQVQGVYSESTGVHDRDPVDLEIETALMSR